MTIKYVIFKRIWQYTHTFDMFANDVWQLKIIRSAETYGHIIIINIMYLAGRYHIRVIMSLWHIKSPYIYIYIGIVLICDLRLLYFDNTKRLKSEQFIVIPEHIRNSDLNEFDLLRNLIIKALFFIKHNFVEMFFIGLAGSLNFTTSNCNFV